MLPFYRGLVKVGTESIQGQSQNSKPMCLDSKSYYIFYYYIEQ
jgi:hypothetical protein